MENQHKGRACRGVFHDDSVPLLLYDRQMEGFLPLLGKTSLRHIKSVHPCHQQLWSKTDLSATTPLGPHQMRESLRGKSKLCSPREGLANPL